MQIYLASMDARGIIDQSVLNFAAQAKRVVVQTELPELRLPNSSDWISLDNAFENADDFHSLNDSAAEEILHDGTLFICVGEPVLNEIAVSAARKALAADGQLSVRSGDPALRLAMETGLVDRVCNIHTCTASSFERVSDTDVMLVIHEISSRVSASELKIRLAQYYGDEHPVLLCDIAKNTCEKIPVHAIDQSSGYGYAVSLVVPPAPLQQKARYTFADLVTVMDRLRAPGGCPWDRAQTHESLKRYLVEESYEVLEAIDEQDSEALYDELGDVLLQIVFHAKIGQQSGEFDISDVTTAICEKMIARHTHIFGTDVAHTPDDVVKNWEQIKREEKGHESQTEVLHGVPRSMPALMRSGKVQHKAAHVGFDFRETGESIEKLREEIREVEQDIVDGRDMWEECGDLLFAAVNVVRMLGVEPELALQKATDKFIARFAEVEQIAQMNGIDMHTCTIDKLDEIWNQAKNNVKKSL